MTTLRFLAACETMPTSSSESLATGLETGAGEDSSVDDLLLPPVLSLGLDEVVGAVAVAPTFACS